MLSRGVSKDDPLCLGAALQRQAKTEVMGAGFTYVALIDVHKRQITFSLGSHLYSWRRTSETLCLTRSWNLQMIMIFLGGTWFLNAGESCGT